MSTPTSALLLYRDQNEREHEYPLVEDRAITIGRGEDSDISLPWDHSVSSIHAQALPLGSHWLISDEGVSRNGTFVNGERLSGRRRLRHGDTIRVGRTLLSFTDHRGRRGDTTSADAMDSMGIVTLLFSDVVGSTELMGEIGDDRADDVRRELFDAARTVADEHGGRMVKTLGDGVMLAFPSALEAVATAAALHETTTETVALRIGLNAGEAISVDDDYFGTSVVVAKRLCDYAKPGQTLVSAVVQALVGSRGSFQFIPRGPLPLKGLDQPVYAFEVWPPPAD